MKIAEVKNGNVRYAENKIAHAGSSVSVNGGPKRTKPDKPDFMEYLSEKDRRRWDRLSDSKKERILRRAERPAAVRETLQLTVSKEYTQNHTTVAAGTVPALIVSERLPAAEHQTSRTNTGINIRINANVKTSVITSRNTSGITNGNIGGNARVSVKTAISPEADQSISGYEFENEAENDFSSEIVAATGAESERRNSGTHIETYSGRSLLQERKGFFGRKTGYADTTAIGRENGIPRRSSGRSRASDTGSRSLCGNRIKNRVTSGMQIKSVPSGSGGVVGFAASTAKKTAVKVSGALREKANQISTGDAAKNLEDFEKATDDVKKVTGPIKRIVAAIFALLSLILGPILFVGIMIVILVVVIIFLVAWLISILVPAMVAGPGLVSGSGLMPYYCQQDDRWAAYPFNGKSISTDGCGMTSMAMIMACLTGDMNIIPPTIVDTGYNTVSSHGAPTGIASVYGITDIEQMGGPSRNDCGVSEYDEAYLLDKIGEGCPVLVSVTGTYLGVSTTGHYFVIYGQGENGVFVYDPATLGRIYQESISGGGSDWNDTIHDAKHIWIFPAPESKVEGDTNAEKIFRYLVKAGWSEAAAAGAVGNFYQEAGGGGTADINPASYDSGSWGEAGGIAGFTDNGDAANFTGLKNYAAQRGKNWTDLQIQCEYLLYQLSNGKWWGAYDTPTYTQMAAQGYSVQHMTYEEFTQLTNVDEAVKAFLCFYEDCGYRMAHYEDVRLPMAMQALTAWGSRSQ